MQSCRSDTILPSNGKPSRIWQANAIIGSLTEIVLQAIEQDRVEQLPECADEAAQVIRAAMQSQLAHPVIPPEPGTDPH